MEANRRRAMKTPIPRRQALVDFAVLVVLGFALAACGQTGATASSAPIASVTPTSSIGPIASGSATYEIHGIAVAGPTCPVEPASPVAGQCAPRPVAGAVLVITDATGHEVTRVTTAGDGTFQTRVAAGAYTLTPQPVEGLMGTARPLDVVVSLTTDAGSLTIEYDTGIR